jgi:hypothetical protein
MKGDPYDPKALIREAYQIAGISAGECRSIFLDWALGVPLGQDVGAWVQVLLIRHADARADHPMTITLQEALSAAPVARRRGGRAMRLGENTGPSSE